MVVRHGPCHHDRLLIKWGYISCVPTVRTVCTILDLTGAAVAFEKSPSWASTITTMVSAGLFLLSFCVLHFAFSSKREGGCLLTVVLLYCCYGGSAWENESNYVSFNLPVDIRHPYSFDVTQLFDQMDFKFLGHLMCCVSATTGKTDCWNNQ